MSEFWKICRISHRARKTCSQPLHIFGGERAPPNPDRSSACWSPVCTCSLQFAHIKGSNRFFLPARIATNLFVSVESNEKLSKTPGGHDCVKHLLVSANLGDSSFSESFRVSHSQSIVCRPVFVSVTLNAEFHWLGLTAWHVCACVGGWQKCVNVRLEVGQKYVILIFALYSESKFTLRFE